MNPTGKEGRWGGRTLRLRLKRRFGRSGEKREDLAGSVFQCVPHGVKTNLPQLRPQQGSFTFPLMRLSGPLRDVIAARAEDDFSADVPPCRVAADGERPAGGLEQKRESGKPVEPGHGPPEEPEEL